jgi:hypothetical protein
MAVAASAEPNSIAKPPVGELRLAAFEVVWIFLIFFLAAGSPPPDAGESHYWVKAKHYWNPAWCAGDLFVESHDAHLAFDWALGWLTKFMSLPAAVWTARVIVWGLLAWAWRRLSWAIVPVPLAALLSAGLMLLLARHGNMAREIVFRGGVEAKTLAYVFVFLALESVVRERWRAALLLSGTAGAFHVLVGGWATVAIGLAWLLAGKARPALTKMLPAVLGGLLLALPGLVPGILLNRGVDPETVREAARIYVFERLQHHLVFHAFGTWHIARFALLVAGWVFLVWLLRKDKDADRLKLFHRVVLGSLVLVGIGILIDQAAVINERVELRGYEEYQRRAARLLRYYWFRLADVLVPAGVALGLVVGLQRVHARRPQLANYLLAAAILLAGGDLAWVCYERAQNRISGAAIQEQVIDQAKQAQWRAACNWIAANTPEDAKFLTPRRQQTFKWYAGRAEVATWKDLPQDARSIVAWHQALREIHPRTLPHLRNDLAAFSDAELTALARKYGVTYVVIDRTKSSRPIGLPTVYPEFVEENPAFAVYRVPAKMEP